MSIHTSSITQHKGLMPATADAKRIQYESMFFRASPKFAEDEGDDLTIAFLQSASSLWGNLDDCIIDTRWHYLMPGMYPCIPGWHVDDAPRDPKKYGGQPDLWTDGVGPEHLLCVVDTGTGSLTQFLESAPFIPKTVLVEDLEHSGANFFKTADQLIEFQRSMHNGIKTTTVDPGAIVEFDSRSWHRGMPATGKGFRWFARMTRGSHHKPANEIRHNSQVYLTDANQGW
jgi:hypothetical protein